MKLTDAKIVYVHLGEAIRDAENRGAETVDLVESSALFDDQARDELQRAINEAKRRQPDD